MRYIIMHKTNPHWEAGATPSPELIARVGALVGELAQAGLFLGGEGLRASSEGVRITFAEGTRTIVNGPFEGGNELPAGFSILRARALDEAIDWATRQAPVLRDEEVDIRPVTEPWDIGLAPRPADVSIRRYMVLRKATAATESGAAPSLSQRGALSRLIEETTRSGLHVVTETMAPSRRGRRYKNSVDGVSVFDGPFVETKELLAGYTMLSAGSLEDVDRSARRYLVAVEADEVDVRELE
jgi:hypothetical protein